MNPHFVRIPCLTSLSARRLPRRNLQALGGQAHRALDAEIFGFGALKQFLADLFEGTDFAAGERDAEGLLARSFPLGAILHPWLPDFVDRLNYKGEQLVEE